MKLLLKSIVIASVLSFFFSMIPFNAQCEGISKEVFRLHILANSDSKADQDLKLKVRDKVLEYTDSIFRNAESLSCAEKLTDRELQKIADVAKSEIARLGYDYSVKAEIKHMYFNTRYYEAVTMPSGFYDGLRITIGEGKGHNWWCVMYPSLCVGAGTNYEELKKKTSDEDYNLMTEGKYNFQFKITEVFNGLCALFA